VIIGAGFGVAGEKAREWPLENWSRLIELLVPDGKCTVVLFGTSRDKEDGDKIKSMISGRYQSFVFNLCGKTTLEEFAGCLKNISIYLSVDTGGLHIAAALGLPVVGLYVPGQDERWSPRSSRDQSRVKVISKKEAVDCAPCSQSKMKYCHDNRCIRAITVGEVFDAVRVLKDKLSSSSS